MLKFVEVVLYVLLMAGVSLYARRKTKEGEFLLGGRRIGPWFSAIAYGTTYFSAVIFIGYAGRLGWNMGMSVVWIGLGNAAIGAMLSWSLLARRTREMTHRLDVSTMPEFFEKRYDSRPMKIVTAICIFILLLPYSASVYQGLSYMFESVMGIPFAYCAIGMAVITAGYLLLGGYVGSLLADMIQGLFMVAGVIVVIICLFLKTGGVGEAVTSLAAFDTGLTSVLGPNFFTGLLPLIILTSLGSMGLPQMVHKFYAIKNGAAVRSGAVISTVFCLIIAGGAYLHGAFGRVILGNAIPIDPATGAANLDMVIPAMLNITMPEELVGLIIVLVLAASVSTLASVVLSSASILAIDLIKGVFKPDMNAKQTDLTMKALCMVFIVFSVIVALNKQTAIVTLMSLSWGGVAGITLGPFIYGLYWKGVTKIGAWSGIVAGIGITVVLTLLWGTGSSPMIGTLSMIASLVCVPVVSLMTKGYDAKHLERIFPKDYKALLKKI